MAMRDLVTGGAACAVEGSSSSSNPLGALANALIGSSSKTQDKLKEIPTPTPATGDPSYYSGTNEPLTTLPGSEFDHPPSAQGAEFFQGFRSVGQGVWDEIQNPQLPSFQGRDSLINLPPIEHGVRVHGRSQLDLDGPPQRVLSGFLRSFVNSSQGGIPFHPTPLPVLGLSEGDKQCIRDRTSIMARHFFADKSEDFINAQVNALLSSLDIDNNMRARGPLPGRFHELEEYWGESQGMLKPVPHAADGWVDEFVQHRVDHGDPNSWAQSFERHHGANGWASEFEHVEDFGTNPVGASYEDKDTLRSLYKQELTFCEKVKERLHSDDYQAFLKCLHIYSTEIISRKELQGLIADLLGKYPDLMEGFNEVLERENIDVLLAGVMNKKSVWTEGHVSKSGKVEDKDKEHKREPEVAKEKEQSQIASMNQMGGANIPNLAAMEQTRMLAHTLAQNNDPKFQNSKFLQFVSKMSRGELIIEDNQVKPTVVSAPGDWAAEYEQQYNEGDAWADQFMRNEISHGPDRWANEFAREREQHGSVDDQWVNEFSKLNVQDWAEEFGNQVGEGALGESSDDWTHAYDEFLNEQIAAKQQSERGGVYQFSDMNPYVGHTNPLKEGHELFRKGLLSEAVLALEAEVLKNPDNAEAWRLLGIAHAENDDDEQAIAAMMRAQEVDPTNLEVLLALGVSHTNELEQAAALKYLYGWLHHHPKYGNLAPPEMSDSPYFADVARLFVDAAQMSPEDADLHIVLGVLYNLSREYEKAIDSFKAALKLKPQDYSLWNKLGATQANSVQSADAIQAYQQALDLKPNYVRAWANMGISYANQGMYEESIRYYVRALAMNPKADNAWQYLRISLSCASRNDMFEACDSRNLDILQKEFPL